MGSEGIPLATTTKVPGSGPWKGNVEPGLDWSCTCGNAHGAVIVSSCVEDVAGAGVGDANERVVGGALIVFVAECAGLGEAIELLAKDAVGASAVESAKRRCRR